VRVYISVDIEGVAGVVHVDQSRRTGHDYERARRWMTAETNAAVLGAFDAGATSVLVNDSHGDMRNLLLDELDRRVEVVSGSLKPLSMVEGVTNKLDCALFVGYHAGAASKAGILDHTYYGRVVAKLRVCPAGQNESGPLHSGGRDWNETAINAAVCGELGVPVALVTGDQTCCAQAKEHLGDSVVTVQVKEAITRYKARSLMPAVACEKIREGAALAVRNVQRGLVKPFRPAPPFDLEIDFVQSACADVAELVPGTHRVSGATCSFRAPNAQVLLQVIQAWTILAGTTVV
jgi:D-amino peptidase